MQKVVSNKVIYLFVIRIFYFGYFLIQGRLKQFKFYCLILNTWRLFGRLDIEPPPSNQVSCSAVDNTSCPYKIICKGNSSGNHL